MFKPEEEYAPPEISQRDSFNVLSSPYWIGVFLLVALPFTVIFFFIGTFFNLENFSYEQRYAIIALLSGICSDFFLRRWLYVALAIARRPPIPLVGLWILLCIVVLTLQPIKNFDVWF